MGLVEPFSKQSFKYNKSAHSRTPEPNVRRPECLNLKKKNNDIT